MELKVVFFIMIVFISKSWAAKNATKVCPSTTPDLQPPHLQKRIFTYNLTDCGEGSNSNYFGEDGTNEKLIIFEGNPRITIKRQKTNNKAPFRKRAESSNNYLLSSSKNSHKIEKKQSGYHLRDKNNHYDRMPEVNNLGNKNSEKLKFKTGGEFKLTIGTIKLPKLRTPRKPSRLKNKAVTSAGFLNGSNFKIFHGVSTDEEKILNILISTDIQTGFMKFVDMAYESMTNINEFYDNLKIENEKKNDFFPYRCGLKFGLDLEKIIDLNRVFIVQTKKVLSFVNILNSLFANIEMNFNHTLFEKMLKTFLYSDKQILATGIYFEPFHNNKEREILNPYVAKIGGTMFSNFSNVQIFRDEDNDVFEFGLYKYFINNKTVNKRQTVIPSEDNKFYERLHEEYFNKINRRENLCANERSNEKIAFTLKNESIWGHMQSDCNLRKMFLSNKDHLQQFPDSLKGVWTVPYFMPFFGCSDQKELVFRGVLKVVLDLTPLEFNQCENDNKTFLIYLQHNCPPTTQCQHLAGGGFRRGNYRCLCSNLKPLEPSNNKFSNISSDTTEYLTKPNIEMYDDDQLETNKNDDDFEETVKFTSKQCFWAGNLLENCNMNRILNRSSSDFKLNASFSENCTNCFMYTDGMGCPNLKLYEEMELQHLEMQQQWSEDYNYWMKGLPLGIQCFTILTGFAIIVLIARLKKNKVMKMSVWVLLEFTVIGALVLHSSVILAYFDATPNICLTTSWFREIGFLFLYGSLLLKHQRTLSEFQSRKAHRVQWKDKDLVRCLIIMMTILIINMAAWTASVFDNLSNIEGLTADIRIEPKKFIISTYPLFTVLYRICQLSLKDRLLEAGELAILAYIIYMCYKVRKAPSEYNENKHITFCVINETLVSVLYYSFRYFFSSMLHPDCMFLASFLRHHVTASVAVVLVVCSKLWYSCCPSSTDYRARSCSSAPSVDSRSVQFNNPSSPPPTSPPIQFDPLKSNLTNFEEIDISNMTPDDIRYELRKLYTQLQIYKTKTMRQDNPHISKRRGGKKQTNRKFSFQNLHAKYKQQSSVTSQNAAATTPSGSVGGGTSMGGDHCENSTATAGGEIDLSVRSPEDSSNSMEGVSVYMDENSYASPDINASSGKDGGYAAKKQQNAFKSILSAARSKSSKQAN